MMKIAFTFFLAAIFSLSLHAQAPEQSEVSLLFQQGRYSEAAKALNTAVKSKAGKNDPDLWNKLGLAETSLGDFKKAVKAFKKSVDLNGTDSIVWANLGYAQLRLRDLNGAQSATDRAVKVDPNNVFAYYVRGLAHLWEGDLDQAQKNYLEMKNRDKKFSDGYVLGSWVELAKLNRAVSKSKTDEPGNIRDHLDLLKNAVDILQAGIDNCSGCSGKENLFKEYEGLTYFYDHFSKQPRTKQPGVPLEPEPGVTPYKIISKPRAVYTDAARNALARGTVRLVVLLRSDGRVGHIFVLKRLGYGLDENAIAAARSITFEPKMSYGKPVPAVVTIEYGFNIY